MTDFQYLMNELERKTNNVNRPPRQKGPNDGRSGGGWGDQGRER
jgi:hypothetical protein